PDAPRTGGWNLSRFASSAVLLVGVALAGRAAAQTFPVASAYVPFTCGSGPMTDALNDTPTATGALDLVGTNAFPTAFHAADTQFLYLRLRLAATPLTGGNLIADAWGYEFDINLDRATYEVLISASGIGNNDVVAVYRHPTAAVN